MENRIIYEENNAIVLLCQQIYEKEAILTASYMLTELHCLTISITGSDYEVVISRKDKKTVNSSDIDSFINNCLDEQLRIALGKRTGKIRELIVEHAFKPLNIQHELEKINAR